MFSNVVVQSTRRHWMLRNPEKISVKPSSSLAAAAAAAAAVAAMLGNLEFWGVGFSCYCQFPDTCLVHSPC